jgi:hypothetical protein
MKWVAYPGWRLRVENGIVYHEPLIWWKRWPLQLVAPLILRWRKVFH